MFNKNMKYFKIIIHVRVDFHGRQIQREKRSYIISRIRSNDTKPEILVRSYLFRRGLKLRKNDRRYPGSPDVVLPKYRTIVFVRGCFWHLHEGCKYYKIPNSNVEYWETSSTETGNERNKTRKSLKIWVGQSSQFGSANLKRTNVRRLSRNCIIR